MATPAKNSDKAMNKTKTAANALATVGLILVGLIALNVVGSRAYKRADFTKDKIYTLSPASKELVASLPDRMTVKAFISADLQPPFSQTAQYLRDILDEYAAASKGKLHWEAIDPGSDQKLQEEAQKFKVQKIRRGRISSAKVELGESYLGVAFQYQGNIESIPEINAPDGLEFQMSSLIKKMTVKKKKIAFATSEGELASTGNPESSRGLQFVTQYLGDYEVKQVDLNKGDKPLDDDVDALIVAGPKTPFSERAKFVMEQFLLRGKAVALFVDGMVIDQPQQMKMPGMENQPRIGRKNDTGLDDLLEHWGVKLRDDIVLEPEFNVPGPVPVGGQMYVANYPTFVGTKKLGKHATTTGVQAIVLPFPSSIEKLAGKQAGVTVTELATSMPNAWHQSGFFLFDPQNAKLKPSEDKGPFTFAVALEGTFTSMWAGKPYPNDKGEKVTPPDANASSAPGADKPLDQSAKPGRLVLVSDSEFFTDDYLRFGRALPVYLENARFFLGIMDWIGSDEQLASLRAKVLQSRPITVESEATQTLVKYGNIVGVPLAFIVFGLVRWRLRRARRKAARL